MLSVLIETKGGDEEKLARTLASLVPAAVESAVREVIVIAAEEEAGLVAVAEHAGCRALSSLPAGVAAAKCEWLLLLEPGARLAEGWFESAMEHVSGRGRPARLSAAGSGLGALADALRLRRKPLRHGLLIARARMQEAVGRSAADGVPAYPRRLRRLSGRIVPAH